MSFDMPPLSAGWPACGRWLIDNYTRDLTLKDFQAGGIVGNLGYESNGLQTLQEVDPVAGRGGWGWEQATGPRRRAFEAWSAAHNLSSASPEANYGFILDELRGPYRHVVDLLRSARTLESAVFIFGVDDEAPGGTTTTFLPGDAGRLERAREAMAGSYVATAPPVFPLTIHAGMTDEVVRDVQRFLGFTGVDLDGDFGIEKTMAAVAAWQKAHGLPETGAVDYITWNLMFGVKP